jgi:Uncharacterized protein conserved in bacteria (DUF2330)
MFRKTTVVLSALTIVALGAGPALACGGLVNPNGTVSLVKSTTLAAYVDGVEHYVTNFEFAGGGGKFGSIVPLPGIPSDVERAGDWTLQRLVEEITPPEPERFALFDTAAGESASKAEVILETRIDALDITVLKGGGDEVGEWAKDNGFELPPDSPEMLDYYASRSPIFMAASFNAKAARNAGQQIGDGTPIHLSIPTPNPWVPIRILTLGLPGDARVKADVFLLTENVPEMLPAPVVGQDKGMILERSERASELLLTDLESDKGMGWLPTEDMWFSYLKIDADAADLRHDLAIDATGVGEPSPIAAGLEFPVPALPDFPETTHPVWAWVAGLTALWGLIAIRNGLTA